MKVTVGHFSGTGNTLGPLFGHFGITLGSPGVTLGSLWCYFGSLWSHSGVILANLSVYVGSFYLYEGDIGSLWNHIGAIFGVWKQVCKKTSFFQWILMILWSTGTGSGSLWGHTGITLVLFLVNDGGLGWLFGHFRLQKWRGCAYVVAWRDWKPKILKNY